jgi:hypothetical protein
MSTRGGAARPAAGLDTMTTEHEQRAVSSQEQGDAGIGVTSVLVMLGVLAVLVVGIFWLLPAYFGSQMIEVTIR